MAMRAMGVLIGCLLLRGCLVLRPSYDSSVADRRNATEWLQPSAYGGGRRVVRPHPGSWHVPLGQAAQVGEPTRFRLAQPRAQSLQHAPGDLGPIVQQLFEVRVIDGQSMHVLVDGDRGGPRFAVDHADLAEVITLAECADRAGVVTDRGPAGQDQVEPVAGVTFAGDAFALHVRDLAGTREELLRVTFGQSSEQVNSRKQLFWRACGTSHRNSLGRGPTSRGPLQGSPVGERAERPDRGQC